MRKLVALLLLIAPTAAIASDAEFCAMGAPQLRTEAEAAEALLESSDKMAQPIIDSGIEASLTTLEGVLEGPELAAFTDYARSYDSLRPALVSYIEKLQIAASLLEDCASE